MRVICFFDLPTITSAERREYRAFRKFLVKTGFLMLQESVYCKLTQNTSVADTVIESIRKNKPSSGLVQVIKVTEKQYNNMEYIVGTRISEVIDTDERLIIL